MTPREWKRFWIVGAIGVGVTVPLYVVLEWLGVSGALLCAVVSTPGIIALTVYQKLDERKEAAEKREALKSENPL